jgi:hypothetical protein
LLTEFCLVQSIFAWFTRKCDAKFRTAISYGKLPNAVASISKNGDWAIRPAVPEFCLNHAKIGSAA